ncbi:nitrate/sulfonate/bicarbonate ABC transporter ATP-binding protein [Streptococcus varani]|uniref:Nitrate/sulfonate/bicarbonate ABC transporter ATP-binding protein n=1 Tax=Streptococcus varani TaxID=1608583 RepID=A0A0E3WEL9_9STRE|nr:ABC transporter ATP-binding protein [Streptococcus varani]CQR23915.1 nitrate/sulfonate/bicarbonate ABC transporter ATP-binding protein [Streptococcus varani]
MKKLELKELTFAYEEAPIIKDINLHVDQGEIVSILGPSGVGKTTLFNLIAGILPVQEGKIMVDGLDNPKGKVSYMLQKDLLLEHKTILGNVILPLTIRGIKKVQAVQEADALLIEFGLDSVRDAYPHELSGGMRQRIALLRTYLFGHDLFLLDEAFSALDEMTKMTLHDWYLNIHKQFKLTTILITHSIYEAIKLSDRIYVLNHKPGQIVAELNMDWKNAEQPELAKLQYKEEILNRLGLKSS